jgi:predicted enzyme related to lactoylglutathione lyase
MLDGSVVAFVPTTDMDAARAFYSEALGLTRTSSSPFADTYDIGGTEVRVTAVEQLTPAPFTVLGWAVADIDQGLAQLRSGGVEPARFPSVRQDDRGVWTAPDGTRVVWFHDPAGNVLSLHQAGTALV